MKRIYVLRKIKSYILPLKGPIIMICLINALLIPTTLISPHLFRILIDKVLIGKNLNMAHIVVVGLLGVYVVRLVLDGGALFWGNHLLNRFTLQLSTDIFEKYQKAPVSFWEQNEAGDLKMRIMDDVDSLGSFIREQVVDYFFSIFLAFFTLAICITMKWKMSLLCLSIIPVLFFINLFIGKGTQKINEEIREVNQEYYSFVHNSLQFWREIKIQNAEDAFVGKFKKYRLVLAKLGMRFIRYWSYSEIFNDFKANYLTRVWVYLVGSLFVIHGELSIGTLMMFAEYFVLLLGALDTINSKKFALRVTFPYYHRIFDTLSLSEETYEDNVGKEFTGQIKMSNITFGYYEDQTVLRNINLSIERGDYVAIIGKTGCGKTTLAKLILGMYEPRSGKILYENNSLRSIGRKSLYSQIGVVMQDNFLFNMTIKENLCLAKADAAESELEKACERANILDFIKSLDKGFDTVIGERGLKLSGGQKQRLCIARALLPNPKVILFDEASSSIDKQSEEIINHFINELGLNITVIVITHNPDTMLRARRIIVMDDGEIVDDGTHEEVISRNKYYQKILESRRTA